MLTLFGNIDSGNVHKVQMIFSRLGLPFRRVDVRQDQGEPRDARFLAINPMGKVPAVRLLDGDILSDSGAILFYFLSGTALWPDVRRDQAEVRRWMFFEQSNFDLEFCCRLSRPRREVRLVPSARSLSARTKCGIRP